MTDTATERTEPIGFDGGQLGYHPELDDATEVDNQPIDPGCWGKHRWPSPQAARTQIHNSKVPLVTYQCKSCRWWHVGRDL